MVDTKDFLRSTKLLKDFEQSEINTLDKYIQVIDFPSDTEIVRQGNPINGLYLVLEGHIHVSVQLPGDRRIKLAILSEKDFFGDLSLISKGMAAASITTMEPTRCILINHEIFTAFQLIDRNLTYKLTVAINHQVCARIQHGIYRIAGFLNDIKEHIEMPTNLLDNNPLLTLELLETENIPLSLLTQLDAFKEMSLDQLKTLIPFFEIVKLPKNYLIAAANENVDNNCYVIVQGAVSVTAKRQNRITKLRVLGPGNMIVPMYQPVNSPEGSPIPATYITRENAILFKMEVDQVHNLYNKDATLYDHWHMAVSRSLVSMLQSINKQLIRYQSEFPAETFFSSVKG